MNYETSGNVYLKLIVITSVLVVVFQFATMMLDSESLELAKVDQNQEEIDTSITNKEQYQSAYAANY